MVQHVIAIDQIGHPGKHNSYFIHTGGRASGETLSKKLKEIADDASLSTNFVQMEGTELPPSPLDSYVTENGDTVSGVVISGYAKHFGEANRYYHSYADTGSAYVRGKAIAEVATVVAKTSIAIAFNEPESAWTPEQRSAFEGIW